MKAVIPYKFEYDDIDSHIDCRLYHYKPADSMFQSGYNNDYYSNDKYNSMFNVTSIYKAPYYVTRPYYKGSKTKCIIFL